MQTNMIRKSGEILAVAIAYYITARLGLLLAIPPGYATAIWPPAGIALSAILIFGYRVMPGVWLGSLLANAGTYFDQTSISLLMKSIFLPMSISTGAILEALVGAFLIRRFVGFPTPLNRTWDIIKFLGLGGPFSCLISASIGVTSLFLSGSLPLQSYVFNWCTWWIGDTIGVLITTPLVLIWMGKPREIWSRRWGTVAVPLCLMLTAIILVFIGTRGEFLSEKQSLTNWIVLAGGLAFTGLLGAFLLVVSGHTMLVEQAELALRESEAQLRATFEQAAVGIAHISQLERRFLRVNEAFCRMVGYESSELLHLTASDITYPEDVLVGAEQYTQIIAGEISNFTMEKRYICKQKQVIWARTTISAVRRDNTLLYMMSVIEDITEAKIADQARKDTEQRLKLAIGIAQLGSWEWNVVTNEIYWSPLFKKQLGYEDHELSNHIKEWKSRLHPEERHRILKYVARCIKQPVPEYELEYQLLHRDGGYRWFLARALPVIGHMGDVVKLIGTHLDVTARKLSEQHIREAAQHDALTGLPNRALIFEYANCLLDAAQRNRSHGALLFIDLDRFKQINDLYGHEVGDHLLQAVTKRLLGCIRKEDLIGRLGGDEFVIVLANLDTDHQAEIVAQHVLNDIGRPFHIDSHELSVSLSIGISHYPKHGEDIDTLVHAADIAMYQAKQSGRANYQLYSTEFDQCADELLYLEKALKRALISDGLAIYYQPVIDMKSGRPIGAEALLRLVGENTETSGPQRFIPVAEATGMISQLGAWVITEVCRQHAEWMCQGLPPIQISINVSPIQFRQKAFVEKLTHIVSDSGIKPACLQIEVTESAVMENIDEAVETLQKIKSLGIKVALDDFGTGYSSLSHLSTLPLDKLKVDQSFIKCVEHDRTSRAITKTIIALGRTLKLEVIGEGIESEDALAYLRRQGCDQVQGFLFSRPLPATDFAKWYRERSVTT